MSYDKNDRRDGSGKPPGPGYDIGYGKPPKRGQFTKGKSGNPKGRPKAPSMEVNIKQLLDGDQEGKNGELVSKREAIVGRIINDALAGNQKAFARFFKLLNRAGLVARASDPNNLKSIGALTVMMTAEESAEWRRNFGKPHRE